MESVTLASALPLALGYNEVPTQLPESDKKIPVGQAAVDGDYFSTFGIRLLSGRVFNSGDRENTPEVVVINRTMADLLWPGLDPLGKTVLAGDTPRKATVIGVAANGKYESFDEPARAVMYVALSQHYQEFGCRWSQGPKATRVYGSSRSIKPCKAWVSSSRSVR